MIQSYQRLLEMDSIATLKIEQDRKALEKIRKILYQNKNFIIDKLISYLKNELNLNYYKYQITDMDGNIADILVKTDSEIFENEIKDKEFLKFNVEELIDSRMFKNDSEIIILDMNFDENLINLGYLCDSLNYNYLSYSAEIKDTLTIFIDYVINKNISKK